MSEQTGTPSSRDDRAPAPGHDASAQSEASARPASRGGAAIPEELADARATIDNIDAALIHILAERFRCTQKVGHIKAEHDLPPEDPAREARQVARMRRLAEESGLDPDFAEKFLSFMVREVIRHHEDIKRDYERR
ncbi:chorismate mutase [Actinomyces provencensis]|uniref:chorismate mutase n=1 Tax=Actinomyces provencensis TaxID=1720198 RepID=UPI00098FA1F1|nr:chorismate mutase [Actinomyces provencensis]